MGMKSHSRIRRTQMLAAATVAALAMATVAASPGWADHTAASKPADHSSRTSTPIKHLVVLFDENVSFDHYFGTYPQAANTDGTTFKAVKGTPRSTA